MIRFTPEAAAQVYDLNGHYERLQRTEASRNLRHALRAAIELIGQYKQLGLPAPRPYPHFALNGRLWMKKGAYWVAYDPLPPPTILGVFHEGADIPGRAT